MDNNNVMKKLAWVRRELKTTRTAPMSDELRSELALAITEIEYIVSAINAHAEVISAENNRLKGIIEDASKTLGNIVIKTLEE